ERSLLDLFRGVMIQEACQHGVYWLFGGLPVRDLSRRFDVRLAQEDAWYIYLDLQGEQLRKGGYHRMRVVLVKDSFQVRQFWFELPNGNEITFDFMKHDTNAKITPESIREGLPQGWKRSRPSVCP